MFEEMHISDEDCERLDVVCERGEPVTPNERAATGSKVVPEIHAVSHGSILMNETRSHNAPAHALRLRLMS